MRVALLVFLAGLPGLASLWLVLPEIPGVPRAALLVNPLILLALGAALGGWAAPRAGFVALRPAGWAPRGGELGLGLALGLLVALADHATRGLWQGAGGVPPSLVQGWQPVMLPLGVLYGGVAEEVMLRWGVMSLAVLALGRLLPRRAAVGLGCALAALIFAMGHLPALAASGAALDAPLLARTLALNAGLGVVYGWLFARRDLAAAMLAHAGTHLGFAVAAALG
jgi:hypothetical protein